MESIFMKTKTITIKKLYGNGIKIMKTINIYENDKNYNRNFIEMKYQILFLLNFIFCNFMIKHK